MRGGENEILALVIRNNGTAMLVGSGTATELSVAETVELVSMLVARRCKRDVYVPPVSVHLN